jgi:hypothetical protein
MTLTASGFRLQALAAAPTRAWLLPALVAPFLLLIASVAVAQMPDPRQMSGIPRPVTDLPNGSISVRVIRGEMTNNLVGQPVEMHSGDKVQTVNTDDQGRAQFDNLTPGTPVKFVAVVDGERLESQEFAVQPQGGVRLLLVATDPDAAQKAAEPAVPAVKGFVAVGGESRIIVEPGEDAVTVYYVLDIVNGASAPVIPETPFVFTLPDAAVGTTVIEGSSPLASNKGRQVSVAGPFQPGTTAIQVAAEYPVGSGTVEITQAFPAKIEQLVVIAKKAGDLTLSSRQFERMQESVVEGTPVVVGLGKDLAAGQPMTLTIAGLPHHSSVPRNIALLLAAGVILAGAWAAIRSGGDPADDAAERKRIVARRERLFQELIRLEQDHRRARIDRGRYAVRREELLQSLEHVYGALDEGGTGPEPASRSGVAA